MWLGSLPKAETPGSVATFLPGIARVNDMNIDWSKAPEGATHYDMESELFVSQNSIWVDGKENVRTRKAILASFGRYIPRPANPPTQAWNGKDIPAVGCKCECTFAVEHHDTWHKGKVTFNGIDPEGREFFIVDTGTYQACYRSCEHVRPILTKEQREREEIKNIVADGEKYGHDYIADSMLSAGYRKQESE